MQTQEGNSVGGGAIDNCTNRPILAIGNGPGHAGNSHGDAFLRVIPPQTRTNGGPEIFGGSDYDGVILDPNYQPAMMRGGMILMPREVPLTVPVLKFSDICVARIVSDDNGNPRWQGTLIPQPNNRVTFDTSAIVRTFTGGRYIQPQRTGQSVADGRIPISIVIQRHNLVWRDTHNKNCIHFDTVEFSSRQYF